MTVQASIQSLVNTLALRLRRKAELLRGAYWCWRGVSAGTRFGVGCGVRILYPQHLVVGDDVTIEDYGFLNCLSAGGVRIGNHTSIDHNVWLQGGCGDMLNPAGFFSIGDNSYIGCNAVLGAGRGGIRIGNGVLIAQSVNMHAEMHNFADPERSIRSQGIAYQGIVVEDDVWIGSRATILDGVVIGRGAVVGAGAVVSRAVPPLAVVAGVPARILRYRGQGGR